MKGSNLEKFDVFISFKNSDEQGNLTEDRELAESLYRELTKRSIPTFFSNITLLQLGESIYKESIDKALDSARILVCIGTSISFINSNWVKYEWEGFNNDILCGIKQDSKIVTFTKNILPGQLPRSLRNYQNFRAESDSVTTVTDFIQNIIENHRKTIETVATESDMRVIPIEHERRVSIYSPEYGNEFERLKVQAAKGLETDLNTLNIVLSDLKKQESLSVLDVGSAYGFVAENAFGNDNRFSTVICIDKSGDVIKKAQEIHGESKLKFYQIDVETDEFESKLESALRDNGLEKVDIVFSALTLHHLKDPNKLLRKLRRFLVPGGYILLRGSDDGSKVCYPHDDIMDKIIQKTLTIEGVSDRLNGRKIYSQLQDSGYNNVRIFTFMRDLSSVDYDEREDIFLASFSYRLDYFRKELEKDPYSISAKNDYEWMKKVLEIFEDAFHEKNFWYAEYDYVGIAKK